MSASDMSENRWEGLLLRATRVRDRCRKQIVCRDRMSTLRVARRPRVSLRWRGRRDIVEGWRRLKILYVYSVLRARWGSGMKERWILPFFKNGGFEKGILLALRLWKRCRYDGFELSRNTLMVLVNRSRRKERGWKAGCMLPTQSHEQPFFVQRNEGGHTKAL